MRYFTDKVKEKFGYLCTFLFRNRTPCRIYRMRTPSDLLALLVVGLIFFAGCQGRGIFYDVEDRPAYAVKEQTGPPPRAPAYGWRAKHHYYYYPSAGVYFDIGREVYFYFNGRRWVAAVRLPGGVTVNIKERVLLEIDTSRPYLYYPNHVKKYPPGQLKKKIK